MRAILRHSSIVLIITAATLLGGDPVYSQVTSSAPSWPRQYCLRSPMMIGDKLKISFYETIDVGATKHAGPDGAGPLACVADILSAHGCERRLHASSRMGPFRFRCWAGSRSRDGPWTKFGTSLALSFTNTTGRSRKYRYQDRRSFPDLRGWSR